MKTTNVLASITAALILGTSIVPLAQAQSTGNENQPGRQLEEQQKRRPDRAKRQEQNSGGEQQQKPDRQQRPSQDMQQRQERQKEMLQQRQEKQQEQLQQRQQRQQEMLQQRQQRQQEQTPEQQRQPERQQEMLQQRQQRQQEQLQQRQQRQQQQLEQTQKRRQEKQQDQEQKQPQRGEQQRPPRQTDQQTPRASEGRKEEMRRQLEEQQQRRQQPDQTQDSQKTQPQRPDRGQPGQQGQRQQSGEQMGGGDNQPGRDALRRMRERDNPELNRERQQLAREILNDNRRADQLDEQELRRRLDYNRDALRRPDLSDSEREALRKRLNEDREALRSRVGRGGEGKQQQQQQQRGGGWDRNDQWRGERNRDELVRRYQNDKRRAQELNERDLRRRANDIEWLLAHGRLSPEEERYYRRLLDEDRDYLRRHLRQERAQRWERRDERRRRHRDAVIYIQPGVVFVPQPYISAAEYDDDVIYGQLAAPPLAPVQRTYTYQDILQQPDVRQLMPAIDLDQINFGFNEAFIRPEEIEKLDAIGLAIEEMLLDNPNEVFLLEGHTDAVGSDQANLVLSKQRAEAVKEALLEFYNIQPENLRTVGYGKQFLRIPTPLPEQENRRVSIRRITPLIAAR